MTESTGIPEFWFKNPDTVAAIDHARASYVPPPPPAPVPIIPPLGKLMSQTEIDAANDGLLCYLASEAVGAPVLLDGNGMAAVMHAAGCHDWQMTLVERSGIGLPSIAALAFCPGWQSKVAVRHERPEVAVFRAFLYAFHGVVRASLIA